MLLDLANVVRELQRGGYRRVEGYCRIFLKVFVIKYWIVVTILCIGRGILRFVCHFINKMTLSVHPLYKTPYSVGSHLNPKTNSNLKC